MNSGPDASAHPPRPLTTTTRRDEPQLRHVGALDGIRGVAVAAVLLYHGNDLPGGFLGVDMFFVLSGFLITSLLLVEAARTGWIRLGAFWLRRARRLLPALFLMLLGVCLYCWLLASSTDLSRIRGDALATLFYVANWHSIFANHGYFALFQSPSPLDHTWSLAIEEQFYLVWPIVVLGLVWFTTRRRRARGGSRTAPAVLVVALLLSAASTTAMWLLYRANADPSRVYLGTDTRASSVLLGAALAAWCIWRPQRQRRSSHGGGGWWAGRVALEAAGLVAAVFLGYMWLNASGTGSFLYRGGFLCCGLAAATVIAAAAHPRAGVLARVLSVEPLRALGIISYGVYLWHWPIYVAMTPSNTGLHGNLLLAAQISVTVVVATISFVLVERPIRTGTFPARRFLVAAPAAVVACAVAIFVATAGATASPLAQSQRLHAHSLMINRNAGTRLLVIGDSIGGNLATASESLASDFDLTVYDATSAGCVLTNGVSAARNIIHGQYTYVSPIHRCEPQWNAADEQFLPNKVLLAYGNEGAFSQVLLNGQWVGSCDPSYQTWYIQQMSALIAQYQARGASVYITNVAPVTADWAPDDEAARATCMDQIDARLARAIPHVTLVDLAGFVCPKGDCRGSYEGQAFRVDGLHYSLAAGQYVGAWVLGRLQPQFAPPTTTTTQPPPPSKKLAAGPRPG